MAEQTSEIEKLIKNNIADETARSIDSIEKDAEKKKAEIDDAAEAAINRINGVYTSAVKTLEQLELTDAGIFEFFQKTGGNIRVFEFKTTNWGRLNVSSDYNSEIQDYRANPINLKDKTKYKIIVMAMEIKDTEKPKED